MADRQRMVQNFVQRYGLDGLEWLLGALAAGASGQRIAERFEVSRERVRQWKNAFGAVVSLYQVHPDVAVWLDEARSRDALGPEAGGRGEAAGLVGGELGVESGRGAQPIELVIG